MEREGIGKDIMVVEEENGVNGVEQLLKPHG
jgi:hypothetical protein